MNKESEEIILHETQRFSNLTTYKEKKMEKKRTSEKQVRVIGFLQDEHEIPDVEKFPLPEDYLSKSGFIPKNTREDMMMIKNSWCDKSGNVHFSPNYAPDPFIGTDGEVYCLIGNETMKNQNLVLDKISKGNQLLGRVA